MSMTSRERVAAAMRHETPDRVPVMCQLALGHYFLHAAARPPDLWFDSDTFARTLVEFQRRYRFDGVLVNLCGRPPDWRNYLAQEEPDGPGWRLHWKNGLVTRFPPDDNPQTTGADGAPLARAESAQVATPPAGYLWNTRHAPGLWDVPPDADLADPRAYPDWFTLPLRRVRALAPDVSVHAEVFSPFTHLMEWFAYDRTLVALLDDPAGCRALLERFARMVAAEVRLLAASGPDALLISSAFAGAGFISREMYGEFVLPFERLVAGEAHAAGLPVYTHTCGAIGDRLDLMVETGVDGVDTLDPPPLGTVDLAEAKARFGQRLFFKGNLDAVNEMLRADDRAFESAVRRRLEIGMPGSGYILSSACSVAPAVAPARVRALAELAERYGRY